MTNNNGNDGTIRALRMEAQNKFAAPVLGEA